MPYADPAQKRAHNRRYHQEHREVKLARSRSWVRANPERQKFHQWKHYLGKKYGVTPADYAALMVAQDGRCAICLTSDPAPWDQLSVDHDHETGRVRGLLCMRCNSCLGYVQDSPDLLRKAVRYLEGE
jgi:hypothetical protein